jgi:hypothetical protein
MDCTFPALESSHDQQRSPNLPLEVEPCPDLTKPCEAKKRAGEQRKCMSLNVSYQTIDVGLIQGPVFDYVRGKGRLEALRPRLRRRWEVIRAFAPWKRLVLEVHRDGSDRLPDWFDAAAFERRRYFIVEDAPDRVVELTELYHNAADEDTVRRLIGSQLAILDPESVNEPGRWTPKPITWDWDVEEQVERQMTLLAPYVATPDGEPKNPPGPRIHQRLAAIQRGPPAEWLLGQLLLSRGVGRLGDTGVPRVP